MANERITENIVRKHFEQFSDIIIEEQKSSDMRINKLLQNASKKGSGSGRPEFIITYKNNPDFLIVVECKAVSIKHESSKGDRFSEYAVDGVLLYSSFLSKEFDVLSIAVSGESKNNLRISHFLQLKGEKKSTPLLGDALLPPSNYISCYLESPEKFKQDYNSLLDFTRELNERLHSYKILESQRSLLLSCILIALEDAAFRAAYAKKTTAKSLADFLTKTVSEKLQEANISGDKLDNLNTQFSFIKTDTSLSTKEGVLRDLIRAIDENINQFIKTHSYFDVLGQLYIEFLRYANSDKGLGIVLTPPHITELFSELVQVNQDSIVYDNCTGTGGFLIAAMRKMIVDAKGNEAKIQSIKSSQLIGTEYQAHIFALAVSNMYIHQDGKTNIINKDCFDESVVKYVQKLQPTIGMLNPPYKANKKTDIEELEFVLNNIETLKEGGKCIAIVPMSCALATKDGRILELKKRLLEKNTLEAVLSMPDELFSNSNVGVISCIMIFTAHIPHHKNKETFFGYYKDDGFIKKRNKGRIDAHNKWEDIKEKWVSLFINRKDEAGLSINKSVSPSDEWCAEAYMETNYKTLTADSFINEILKYASHLFYTKRRPMVFDGSISHNKSLCIDASRWKYFEYGQLFRIEKGRDSSNESDAGEYPVISATRENNGINGSISEGNKLFNEGTISVPSNGASTGEAFYQPSSYYATGDVNILHPKFKLNSYIAIFICTVTRMDKYRFNYGRKWGKTRMEKSLIRLPVTSEGEPDWQFMENYIKSLPYSANL